VDKSYQNGREIAQCISNNITIEAHPALGTSKESVKQPDYLVEFKYNAVIDSYNLSPRRNFKTTGRWHKKVGEQNKGYQFKIPNPSLQQECSKHLYH
jgi:hypothetical protein